MHSSTPGDAALCPGQPVLGHRVGLPEARAGGAVLELGTEGEVRILALSSLESLSFIHVFFLHKCLIFRNTALMYYSL